jgi:hypothetical protein
MRLLCPTGGAVEETPGVGEALALIGILGRKLKYKTFSALLLAMPGFSGWALFFGVLV